jgi:hypothetical protein
MERAEKNGVYQKKIQIYSKVNGVEAVYKESKKK